MSRRLPDRVAAALGDRHAAGEAADGAEETDGGDRPGEIVQGGHAGDESAEIDLRLRLEGFAHIIARSAGRELGEPGPDHVAEDEWPMRGRDLINLALQWPSVFLQDASAVAGRQHVEAE